MPSSEFGLNHCLYRNWNWSGIAFIGNGIAVELPLSELSTKRANMRRSRTGDWSVVIGPGPTVHFFLHIFVQ